MTSEDVQLPEGAVFVIANSLAEMNKAATQDFNCRVIECRLVCQILAKRMRLDWKRIRNLYDLQQIVGLGIRHLRALAMETLHDNPYTKGEVSSKIICGIVLKIEIFPFLDLQRISDNAGRTR